MRGNTIAVGVSALLLATVVACGGGSGGKTDTFNISVSGNKSNLGDISATQGDTIQMTVSCDKAEEIHLHGFDLKFECKPGQPVSKTFKADRTGQFEYEIEDTSTHLGNLTITP